MVRSHLDQRCTSFKEASQEAKVAHWWKPSIDVEILTTSSFSMAAESRSPVALNSRTLATGPLKHISTVELIFCMTPNYRQHFRHTVRAQPPITQASSGWTTIILSAPGQMLLSNFLILTSKLVYKCKGAIPQRFGDVHLAFLSCWDAASTNQSTQACILRMVWAPSRK